MAKKQTAAATYAAAQAEVKAELARLAAALDEHAALQKADSRSWGYVGDLTHLAATLRTLLRSPGVGRRLILEDGDVIIDTPGPKK